MSFFVKQIQTKLHSLNMPSRQIGQTIGFRDLLPFVFIKYKSFQKRVVRVYSLLLIVA